MTHVNFSYFIYCLRLIVAEHVLENVDKDMFIPGKIEKKIKNFTAVAFVYLTACSSQKDTLNMNLRLEDWFLSVFGLKEKRTKSI